MDLRETLEFANMECDGYDVTVRNDVAEALTMLTAKTFSVKPGIRTVRLFLWISGLKPIPANINEVLDILNHMG